MDLANFLPNGNYWITEVIELIFGHDIVDESSMSQLGFFLNRIRVASNWNSSIRKYYKFIRMCSSIIGRSPSKKFQPINGTDDNRLFWNALSCIIGRFLRCTRSHRRLLQIICYWTDIRQRVLDVSTANLPRKWLWEFNLRKLSLPIFIIVIESFYGESAIEIDVMKWMIINVSGCALA